MEKTNAKTTDLTGATVNAGDQDVKGVEFGLSGNITPRWGAFGGASFMNGEVKGSGIVCRSARSCRTVPKASFNLWSSYRLPMGLTLGGGTQLQQRQLLQPDRDVQLCRRRHGRQSEVRAQCGGRSGADQVLAFQRRRDVSAEPARAFAGERHEPGQRASTPIAPTIGTSCPGRRGKSCSVRSSRSEATGDHVVLLQIPELLTGEQVAHARRLLDAADWVDGRVTAGRQSAQVKDNLQLPEDHPVGHELGDLILTALQNSALFASAALPNRVFPPLFNLYRGGQSFGNHVDNAIRQIPGTPLRIRTDLSATLFLAEPHEYDGGELIVEDTYGVHPVKLPAGHMVLYPASSLHRVQPVTRGARLASFFWIQSMVRDDAARTVLFDLDTSIQRLSVDVANHPSHRSAHRRVPQPRAALVGHLDACPWRISAAGARHEGTRHEEDQRPS